MKAVFDTRPTSNYDDDLLSHYQFPSRYLDLVRSCVDDWVVLRRPRADGGDLSYFAVAKVASIDANSAEGGLSFARLASYLPFDEPVPWLGNGHYLETSLRQIPRREVGTYLRGRSVRLISDEDFATIVTLGLGTTFRSDLSHSIFGVPFQHIGGEPPDVRVWRYGQALGNRILRDISFRRVVCEAYENRCAVTGLQVADKAGQFEVQAAHIWPVAHGGPDVVQNGIALCGTVHWLFDHHLISLDDQYRVITSPLLDKGAFSGLVLDGISVSLPKERGNWPHAKYVLQHRRVFETCAPNERVGRPLDSN